MTWRWIFCGYNCKKCAPPVRSVEGCGEIVRKSPESGCRFASGTLLTNPNLRPRCSHLRGFLYLQFMAIIDDEYIDAVLENRKKAEEKNKKRIAANEAKGFVLVHAGDGWEIWKQKNLAGGWTYYSDKNSNEGALAIFDNCVIYNLELK
jgi:hypothetical protein